MKTVDVLFLIVAIMCMLLIMVYCYWLGFRKALKTIEDAGIEYKKFKEQTKRIKEMYEFGKKLEEGLNQAFEQIEKL